MLVHLVYLLKMENQKIMIIIKKTIHMQKRMGYIDHFNNHLYLIYFDFIGYLKNIIFLCLICYNNNRTNIYLIII